MSTDLANQVARELGLPVAGVAAVLRLGAEGATVPFIARYRKEQTGSLDEVQLRAILERFEYLTSLEARRQVILESISAQGNLAPDLHARLLACTTKAALEDLYAPFKPKRRTRATLARERGLEPLALRILAQPKDGDPRAEARRFIAADRGVESVEDALAGARDIVAENVTDKADVRGLTREVLLTHGTLVSKKVTGKAAPPPGPTRFDQYLDHTEPVRGVPSHRYLAVERGEREGVLTVDVMLDAERLLVDVLRLSGHRSDSPFGSELVAAARDGVARLLLPSLVSDVRESLKQRSDRAAIQVFAENLRNVLLASPLGPKPVVGIDPGLRTGCKCAAIDATGRFLEAITIYPALGDAAAAQARHELAAFVTVFEPAVIAVGNGTGGRETETFAREVLAAAGHALPVVSVSEAGASIYSASEVAREEFPELDLTLRGAISIARRLQDPLAELVKLDARSIGVGQYQHDVSQPLLEAQLDAVVESCVNQVGVDLNTASAPLLRYVAGIGPKLAQSIVGHRDASGPFGSRAELKRVKGLGPKAFEQAAGFLRIREGQHPLDGSAVHPERYALVERIAADLGTTVRALVGNPPLCGKIDLRRYVDTTVGEPTLRDILAELEKPGRDPRASFEPTRFREDVKSITDLVVGMQLSGIVTNVAAFGAFVDIGVHQDGLVHVSQLADRFVKDPHEVVKVGQRLEVRVLEVDPARKRISLTAKSEVTSPPPPRAPASRPAASPAPAGPLTHNPFAALQKRK